MMADKLKRNELTRLGEAHATATRAADTFKQALGGSRTSENLEAIQNAKALQVVNSMPLELKETIRRADGMVHEIKPDQSGPDPRGLEALRHLPNPDAPRQAGAREGDRSAARHGTQKIATPQALGQLVRQAREAMGLSQSAFADIAGVGRRFVSELENGKPTLELGKVMAVCLVAGLDLMAARR